MFQIIREAIKNIKEILVRVTNTSGYFGYCMPTLTKIRVLNLIKKHFEIYDNLDIDPGN